MAAIPKDLIESELFGHEKGRLPARIPFAGGALSRLTAARCSGRIGDMPLDVQTRLLRVLADGQFYRVGGYAPVKVDVRIIAATHQNTELRVQEGKFREDLFHRLNVIRVHLPPLRERREDIPRLARHFLRWRPASWAWKPSSFTLKPMPPSPVWRGRATYASWKTPAAG